MSSVVRKTDTIAGTFDSEHGGHYHYHDEDGPFPDHPSGTISGYISSNCSPNVFANNLELARVGSTTLEQDECQDGNGTITSGSSTVFVNGYAVALSSSSITPHTSGSVTITSSSSNVFAN